MKFPRSLMGALALAAGLALAAPALARSAGGPAFWVVTGVEPFKTLNVHTGPSPKDRIIARLQNGAVLRNLGCIQQAMRWCEVQDPDGRFRGWVIATTLVEFNGPRPGVGPRPAPGPGMAPGPGRFPPPPYPGAGPRVSVDDMARFCADAAARQFGVWPGELQTTAPFSNERGYVVAGVFRRDPGRGFRCGFDLGGAFTGLYR